MLTRSGQSLVELMIVIGLMAILIPVLYSSFIYISKSKPQVTNRTTALNLLVEAEEGVRVLRDQSWQNIKTNGVFTLNENSGNLSLSPGTQTLGIFNRSITISNVNRDTTGSIVATGGLVDPSTKLVTVDVSWQVPYPSSVNTSFYLTRFVNNNFWEQTTQADFSLGAFIDTISKLTSDGEVELLPATQGSGDFSALNLQDTYDMGSNSDVYSSYVYGDYMYIGTEKQSGEEFIILNVSNPANITFTGSVEVGDGINDIYIVGTYAYLATSSNSAELQVVDISNPASPSIADTLNLGGNQDAYTVSVYLNYAYVGKAAGNNTNREVYVVDVSNPNSLVEVSSIEVGDDVNDIETSSSYLYAATNGTELLIYDLSNPAAPTLQGSYNSPGSFDGEGLFVDSSINRVYLATANSGSGDEFYVIDITNKSLPTLVSSVDIDNTANDVFIACGYAFIPSTSNLDGTIVLNITDEQAIVQENSITNGSTYYSIFIYGDYVYFTSSDNSKHVEIYKGQGCGGGFNYLTSGTFESQTFDAITESAFNYVDFAINEPSNTNINFQVAINNDNSTWNYIGPDGTSATYFEEVGDLSLVSTVGRYFRFKAYFTSDGISTPVLENFSVNYSP